MYTFFKWTRVLFAGLTGVGFVSLPVMGLVFDAGDAVMKPLAFATGGCFVVWFISDFVRGYARHRREGGALGFWQWLKTLERAEPDDIDRHPPSNDDYWVNPAISPAFSDLPYNVYHDPHDHHH